MREHHVNVVNRQAAGFCIAWKQDTLDIEYFAVTAPVVLIVTGVAGIIASLWRKK